MQFNPNPDVTLWLDAVRGAMSRQAYIIKLIRKEMQAETPEQDTITTKGTHDKNILDGASNAPTQISQC